MPPKAIVIASGALLKTTLTRTQAKEYAAWQLTKFFLPTTKQYVKIQEKALKTYRKDKDILDSTFRMGLIAIKLPKTSTIMSSLLKIQNIKAFQPYRKLKEREMLAPKITMSTILRLKPEMFEEPFEIRRLKMFPQLYPVQRQKKRAVPMLALEVSLESLTETVQVPKLDVPQMTEQKQKLLLTPILTSTLKIPTPPPPPTIPTPTIPRAFRLPDIGKEFSRMGGGLFGKWFMRSHAIPTEKQIMRELGFGTRKKSIKRKGGTRRKR
jgi:hypothetical protein